MKNTTSFEKQMLLANLLTTLLYSMTYPYIHSIIIKQIPEYYISLNMIINCLGTIIFSMIWKKYSDKLFTYYHIFSWLECLFTVLLIMGVVLHIISLPAYYLLDVIIFSTLTRNMICAGIKLRALLFTTEHTREKYDNNSNICNAVATLIGSLLSMIIKLPFEFMLIIAMIGNIVDNLIYTRIYCKLSYENK